MFVGRFLYSTMCTHTTTDLGAMVGYLDEAHTLKDWHTVTERGQNENKLDHCTRDLYRMCYRSRPILASDGIAST